MKEKIKQFVRDNSYLSFDDDDDNEVSFTTRENGDVGAEEYSNIDVREARRIGAMLTEAFPSIKLDIDTCDEWVNLVVNF